MSLFSTNIILALTSFELMTNRLMPTVSDQPADRVRHTAATSLSVPQQLCIADNGIILYGQRERLFITDLTNKYVTRQMFCKRFLSG